MSASASVLLLERAPTPYLWILPLFAAASIAAMLLSTRVWTRALWFNLSVAFLALAGAEAHFAGVIGAAKARLGRILEERQPTAPSQVQYFEGYQTNHPILGYAPVKGARGSSKRTIGPEVVYEVTYTIDSLGLRISPPWTTSSPSCALFFGGSFTFGEGVGDDEAMPYVVGATSGLRVYNFAFHGYGPHQMLAALESGLVEEVIGDCHPLALVYQTILDHVQRAAGKRSWDRRGPRYEVDDAGTARLAGTFNDRRGPIRDRLLRSSTIDRLMATSFESDLQLFQSIVATSERRASERWPGTSFEVIIWDEGVDGDASVGRLIEALRGQGTRIHLISEILPDIEVTPQRYRIPKDGHPSPEAHSAIATYLLERVLGR